ncbi:MAG: GPR endopeptidase [Candidatus Limivivens sp.]|nr:GPR endopeptidase [Candidatus Limivivens sp.]
MLGKFHIRTDLALEAKESFEEDDVKIRGVRIEEHEDEETEIRTTTVVIETENGAKTMGKPVGTYITMEAPHMSAPDEDYHREISEELAGHLERLMGEQKKAVLVVGLGNRDVTPDALGPCVVNNIQITRHMLREFGPASMGGQAVEVSGIVPGVMAQTGMETLEIIKGVVEETKPDLILVIDALAARSTRRLSRTIQITDTGINPGSGVGNHRNGINKQVLGIPVIAIGVPTVVDAATIVNDTMENLVETMDASEQMRNFGGALGTLNKVEKHQMIRELISPHLNTMFVTPKDIDETMKRISYTISEGINLALAKISGRTGQPRADQE